MNTKQLFAFALKITGVFILTKSFGLIPYIIQLILENEDWILIAVVAFSFALDVLAFFILTIRTELILDKLFGNSVDEPVTYIAEQLVAMAIMISGVLLLINSIEGVISSFNDNILFAWKFHKPILQNFFLFDLIEPALKSIFGFILIVKRNQLKVWLIEIGGVNGKD